MGIPAELYVLASLVLILSGLVMRSSPTLVAGVGIFPLAVVAYLFGHDMLISAPAILALLAVLCLCLATLAGLLMPRFWRRTVKGRAGRAGSSRQGS